MVKVRAFRTLENTFRRMGFNHRRRRRRGRPRLPGRPGRAPRPSCSNPDRYMPRVCDSKTVTALERERLYDSITAAAVAWAWRRRSREIDTINIHQASLRAMQRAVMKLSPLPDFVLVDAFRVPDLLMAQRSVVHGDAAARRLPRPRSWRR
jgi:hypothetical protein